MNKSIAAAIIATLLPAVAIGQEGDIADIVLAQMEQAPEIFAKPQPLKHSLKGSDTEKYIVDHSRIEEGQAEHDINLHYVWMHEGKFIATETAGSMMVATSPFFCQDLPPIEAFQDIDSVAQIKDKLGVSDHKSSYYIISTNLATRRVDVHRWVKWGKANGVLKYLFIRVSLFADSGEISSFTVRQRDLTTFNAPSQKRGQEQFR